MPAKSKLATRYGNAIKSVIFGLTPRANPKISKFTPFVTYKLQVVIYNFFNLQITSCNLQLFVNKTNLHFIMYNARVEVG
jgi:hypothetical protein